MLQLLLIAAILAPPQLHIDLARDAALACNAHAALQTRLGALDPLALDAAGTGEKEETLQATLEHQGLSWRLKLLRRDGSTALVRELRFKRDECQLVAESAALIIDRYLAALREPKPPPAAATPLIRSHSPPRLAASSTAREKENLEREKRASRRASEAFPAPPLEVAPATIPPIPESAQQPRTDLPPPPIAIAPPPVSVEVIPPPLVTAPPVTAKPSTAAATGPSPPFSRGPLAVALGPAAMLGLSNDLRFAGLLELEHPSELSGRRALPGAPLSWSTRLFLLGTASSSATTRAGDGTPRGEISAHQLLFGLSTGPCASGWLRACGNLFLGARATAGSSSGPMLFDQQAALFMQPELGGLLSLDRQLSPRWQLRLSLLFGAAPGTATLYVRGASPRTLSNVDVAAALLLGYQLF